MTSKITKKAIEEKTWKTKKHGFPNRYRYFVKINGIGYETDYYGELMRQNEDNTYDLIGYAVTKNAFISKVCSNINY